MNNASDNLSAFHTQQDFDWEMILDTLTTFPCIYTYTPTTEFSLFDTTRLHFFHIGPQDEARNKETLATGLFQDLELEISNKMLEMVGQLDLCLFSLLEGTYFCGKVLRQAGCVSRKLHCHDQNQSSNVLSHSSANKALWKPSGLNVTIKINDLLE